MGRFVKRLVIIAIILFVAVRYFDFDFRGSICAVKTVVLDTIDKVIPGSRAQFEDIDSQISSKVAKSEAGKNLSIKAKEATENAGKIFNKFLQRADRFAGKFGIKLRLPRFRRKSYSGNYIFDYANLDISGASELRQKFIDYGMTLRGTPYVLGSETPSSGLDCSGFVRYTARNGIQVQLPRTAREQYEAVMRIPGEEREPGDLLFFRRFGKIDHVGIYLGKYEGEGSLKGREIFLNSASEGPRTGVVVSALDEPYWRRHYSSCGRFLPSHKEVAQSLAQ